MGQKITKISNSVKNSINDPRKRKSWQSGIGITIFSLFVLSSVLISSSVQAVNQLAGNYGYYAGSYGYQASLATSDQFPATPGTQVAGAGNAQVTITWVASVLTKDSTSLDNFSSYVVYYSTTEASVLDTSNAGTNSAGASTWTSSDDSTLTTQGAASAAKNTTITGLTNDTVYYFAVYAVDDPLNYSDAPSAAVTATPSTSGSGTTTSTGGGGGAAAGVTSGAITTPTTTTTTPVAAVTTVVTDTAVVADAAQLTASLGLTRDTAAEADSQTHAQADAAEFNVTLGTTELAEVTNFITYGTSEATINLGSGERRAVARDVMQTLERWSHTAAQQISAGQKPTVRNLPNEVARLPHVLRAWEAMMTHRPDFENDVQDLAWNTLMYRVRFTRNLDKERVGIGKFRGIYDRLPASPFDWAVVRAWGYQLVNL